MSQVRTHNFYISKAIKLFIVPAFMILGVFLPACTTKKNTAATRQWQAFNTRYNVYFNGDLHFQETLSEMEKNYEDDYSRQLLMHPVEARVDFHYPQPTGDFTRTIEKMQKAIELHSITRKPIRRNSSQKEKEFRAREEFNPFLHNAWLMLGKAQYYNGDFTGAASTFMYISKHFKWLPETVTEARLWEALSYCALNWIYNAENTLHLIKEKDLTTENLRIQYNFVQADFLIRSNQIPESLPYLIKSAESASGSQKTRLWFLAGQLYERLGEKKEAYRAFKNAEGGPATSYRTKFNARIKQSEVFYGDNINKEIKSLNALTRYERNRDYLDQIYYAIGNIYLSNKDTLAAKESYRRAIENSTRQSLDMSMAQLALGNIYFAERKYVEAQPCYAMALPFLNADYPGYTVLKLRSDVLDELALYAGNVSLQDSLLYLSGLSKEQQEKVARKLIEELLKKEKLEKEEAQREEYLSSHVSPVSNQTTPFIPMAQANTDNSWYFYNSYTKNVGKTEFQRKWGSRRLEDDWRRKNKNTFSFDDFEVSENEDGTSDNYSYLESSDKSENSKLSILNDPHSIEYYLNQIPHTPEEIENANDIIQESLYNMGMILKNKLNDHSAARFEFQRLIQRYPDNIYRLDVYYNLYLMAAQENDLNEAEIWRKKIISDFPKSNYGIAMKDPDYLENLKKMQQIQDNLYENAYGAYLKNENDIVHKLTRLMEEKYPLSNILPNFIFIDALSYFTEGDIDAFKKKLAELLEKWPDTDMTDIASYILKGIREGRTLQSSGENTKAMVWKENFLKTIEEEMDEETPFDQPQDSELPQYFILLFPLESVNPNKVLFDVAKFNFSTFLVRDFDLEQMNFKEAGLLIVKGLSNLKEAEQYRTLLTKFLPDLNPDIVPLIISKPKFENLVKEGKIFDEFVKLEENEEDSLGR